jgi:hypothetical protein
MHRWILALLIASSAFGAELDTSGIVKRDLGLSPDKLVQEYVKRDANGEFLSTNDWWNTAVACPDCMGGPDTFTVISDYQIKKVSELKYEVTYEIEGSLSGNSFTPAKKKQKDSFTVIKTPWGFKLDNKAFQMVRADVALKNYGNTLDKTSRALLKSIKVITAGPKP